MNKTLIVITSWNIAAIGMVIAILGFFAADYFTLNGAILCVGGGLVGGVAVVALALLEKGGRDDDEG